MTTTLYRLVLLVALLAGISSEAPGQWALSAEVGAARFWGGSADISGSGPSFRPYRPTVFGIGLEREGARLGWGVRLQYAEASLALEGRDAVAAVKGALDVYGLASELTVQLKTLGSGLRIRLGGGPLVEFWDIGTDQSHARVGAQVGTSVQLPLGGRLLAGISVSLAISSSPFDSEDLGPGYVRRALWRRGLSASLHYRL